MRYFEIAAAVESDVDESAVWIVLTEIDENGKEVNSDEYIHDYLYVPEMKFQPDLSYARVLKYRPVFDKVLRLAKKAGTKNPYRLADTLRNIIIEM